MATTKFPKLARAIATEFTPEQMKRLLTTFGRGIDPVAIGDACGNGCGSGCGNSCRRTVGFVFDEFGYLDISRDEMIKGAEDIDGLKRSVQAQVLAFLR